MPQPRSKTQQGPDSETTAQGVSGRKNRDIFESTQPLSGRNCALGTISLGSDSRASHNSSNVELANSDRIVIRDCCGQNEDVLVVSIFDAHGPQSGRLVEFCAKHWSKIAVTNANRLSEEDLQPVTERQSEDEVAEIMDRGTPKTVMGTSAKDQPVRANDSVPALLRHACLETDTALDACPIDDYSSGCAMGSLLYLGRKRQLYVANVGNCRAVAAVKSAGGMYLAKDLSVDHVPSSPREKARVEQAGGRIFTWGVPRIWLPMIDMPGIAISRSFGDRAVQTIGVHAFPDITETDVDETTAFVIMASDGVWQVMTTDEVVSRVAECHSSGRSSQEACTCLVNDATMLWNQTPNKSADSISAVVLYNEGFQRQ